MPDFRPDKQFMDRAISLAKRGRGWVEPNPMVGCVIVKNGQEIASGYHARFGGPHAEQRALSMFRDQDTLSNDCEMYVSLEPCCHHGKTAPCTEAIIRSGIKKVYVAMQDPYPKVRGKGILALRQAGIQVHVGLCEDQVKSLNEAFIKRVDTGTPWVITKWAQTLDGRIATREGNSKWLSGEKSRKWVHQLRSRVDAIVVGIGTVLKDDPQLTARDVRLHRLARRVVVDPHLRLPRDSRLIASLIKLNDAPPITIATSTEASQQQRDRSKALQDLGVDIVELPWTDQSTSVLSLKPLMHHLVDTHNATNILVEGGSILIGSLISQRLVDQVISFVTPRLFADQSAVPIAVGQEVHELADACELRLSSVRKIGEDVMIDYRVK